MLVWWAIRPNDRIRFLLNVYETAKMCLHLAHSSHMFLPAHTYLSWSSYNYITAKHLLNDFVFGREKRNECFCTGDTWTAAYMAIVSIAFMFPNITIFGRWVRWASIEIRKMA